MKLVLNLHEIAQIVVDHLVETNKIPDDKEKVSVTWSFDRYSGWGSTLTIEE